MRLIVLERKCRMSVKAFIAGPDCCADFLALLAPSGTRKMEQQSERLENQFNMGKSFNKRPIIEVIFDHITSKNIMSGFRLK